MRALRSSISRSVRSRPVGLAEEQLQRGDLVAVFFQEDAERGRHLPRALGVGLAVPGVDEGIRADCVNRHFVAPLDVLQLLAQAGIVERRGGLGHRLRLGLFDLCLCRRNARPGKFLGAFAHDVGIDGVEQVHCQRARGFAARQCFDRGPFVIREQAV